MPRSLQSAFQRRRVQNTHASVVLKEIVKILKPHLASLESEMQPTNGNSEKNGDGDAGKSVNQNGGSENISGFNPKVAAKVKKARSFMEMTLTTNPVKSLRRNDRRVLVIYTGGTIGMVKNRDGVLIPQKAAFENLIRGYPQLHDHAFWRSRLSEQGFDTSCLVLPQVKDQDSRIFYKILEYDTLLDSSNMTEAQWIQIAESVMKYYEEYDGFIVLHGTDTMSYTASALSFMFENIGKCVVITGSQIPIFEPRSDGSDNFVSSLLIAGCLNIPEVTVFFGGKLFRGNRVRKISAYNLFAFDSPNCPPLVEVGIDIEFNKKAVFKPTTIERCQLHAKLCRNVGLLRIFPSISSSVIKAFCQPPIEGVVIESYGAGNIPSNRQDLFKEIQDAVKRGVIFVNITQCTTGSVASPLYETGRLLASCGVVSGYDMTPEAALTKLSYVLSKTELTYKEKTELMSTNIRGELTNTSSIAIEDSTLVDALAASLNIQSPKKLIEVTEKVFNSLLLYAIEHDDLIAVKKMLEMGADVNAQNSEGRSPLHEAILKGKHTIVEYLLRNGANVHLKTRCGESPLITAIQCDDLGLIELLQQCGAHLSSVDHKSVSELLSLAARTGAVSKIEALRKAGADLNNVDELKQTPLHKAVLCNFPVMVSYLMQHGVDSSLQDLLGHTALDYAVKLNRNDIVDVLNKPV
ncbi:L-asparaginase [Cydia fagiglandana]|uniref:L-asparaginase n=1 Tax=Cydia fagiglandana TaxID=1458189 RepID=UPI002FEE2965